MKDPSRLPIMCHTSVLGVDIKAHQQAMHEEMQRGDHHGGLKADIIIDTWRGVGPAPPDIRRDIAAWARRNLFEGARPS